MQRRSSQEYVFYNCWQVKAEYMNAIVWNEGGFCSRCDNGDVNLPHRLCKGPE